MRVSVVTALLSIFLAASISEAVAKWIVGTVKADESGAIEINGETAKAIFGRLENIKGQETFGELSKVGKNIRCSRLGIDPQLKNNPAKDYSYKCSFQVGKNGELEPPKAVEGLTPAL